MARCFWVQHPRAADAATASTGAAGDAASSSRAPATGDPVLELMGWKAEPLLLQRLNIYIVEAACEVLGLLAAMWVSETRLPPTGLFVRLLALPLGLVLLKLCWALRLAWSYYSVEGVDVVTTIHRMGHVTSRNCWSCSAATFTCFSCVLMVWYAILFLLMVGYECSPREAPAVRFLLFISLTFLAANWLFWRDFVRNFKENPEEASDMRLIQRIYRMHRSKAIRLAPRHLLAAEAAGTDGKGCAGAAGHAVEPPGCCSVCLEDFAAEEVLAQLPCGHSFHPTCAHKWLCEDWRCPFRCSLGVAKSGEAADAEATAMGPARTVVVARVVGALDLEAGRPRAPSRAS